jgi:hypothetical protein
MCGTRSRRVSIVWRPATRIDDKIPPTPELTATPEQERPTDPKPKSSAGLPICNDNAMLFDANPIFIDDCDTRN